MLEVHDLGDLENLQQALLAYIAGGARGANVHRLLRNVNEEIAAVGAKPWRWEIVTKGREINSWRLNVGGVGAGHQRYLKVRRLADGVVHGIGLSGYVRRFDNVDEAKRYLETSITGEG